MVGRIVSGMGPEKFSADDWLAVIKLATMWDIDAVRALAIARAERKGIEASCQFRAGLDYKIKGWPFQALRVLVEQASVMTGADITALGSDFAALVLQYRERLAHRERYATIGQARSMAPCKTHKSFNARCVSCTGTLTEVPPKSSLAPDLASELAVKTRGLLDAARYPDLVEVASDPGEFSDEESD
jgi:hypothetical protein